jgi:sugar/nucleoside kinase (ribokinase family)
MDPTFVIGGRIAREYILPPVGPPLLDVPGGSALYACGGLLTWESAVGVLARVGEDYPRDCLADLNRLGIDTSGIQIMAQRLDLRAFTAHDADLKITHAAPVSQFARRKLAFPKALLGYQPPDEPRDDPSQTELLSPSHAQMPPAYREARAVHLCPMDFKSHLQLLTSFKAAGVKTLTVDPSPGYLTPRFQRQMGSILEGTTAFLPSEEDLRALFLGDTYDLWEMMAAIGSQGCEVVVTKRGAAGQAVYDSAGRRRWEIPAYPARRADPSGAGDAFCGGFLAGFKRTYDPLQAAFYGNVAASLKVEGSGAFYALGVLEGLAQARLDVIKDMARQV